MDKNMINIDDLVRQRLSGGEEQERPGAWLQMRDLLDQKMPVRPAAGVPWRRMLGALTGLVLLATVTAGSYHLLTSSHEETSRSGRSVAGIDEKLLPTAVRSSNHSAINTPDQSDLNTIVSNLNNPIASNTSDNKTVKPAGKKARTAATANLSSPQGNKNKPEIAASMNNNGVAVSTTVAAKDEQLTASIGPNQGGNNNPFAAANVLASNPGTSAPAPKANTVLPKHNSQHNVSAVQNQPVIATNQARSANNYSSASSSEINTEITKNTKSEINKTTDNSTADNAPFVLKKDTFAQMTIIHRYIVNPLTMASRLVTDTVSIGKMALDTWVANEMKTHASEDKTATASIDKQSVVPSASISLKSSKAAGISEEMVPLSNFKVKSRKTERWNARGFNDVMRDTRFNLAQVKFYPGIIGGVNATVMGPNNINGFQLGLSGLFAFGDQWSLMAELKYFQRFNNGSTFKDDYHVTDQSTQLTSRVEHFFKYSALQSIEMPVALRFAAGRLNLMGGLNMAYNFSPNPEEVTFKYPGEPMATSPWKNSPEKPTVFVDDFNARFSLGYLLGVAYDLSPALQLDFRMTHNVWDNASGTGAKNISSELYKSPSFQLSFGYRFRQHQRVPKAIEYR